MHKPRNGEGGFTLIELMVILAFAGLLAALAAAAFILPRPKGSSGPGGVKTINYPFDADYDTFAVPKASVTITPSPDVTETPIPRTTKSRATKSPSSSPDTGGARRTPVPTQETVPAVEPPHFGPPDSG